jgi:hypothetical protein
VYTSAAMPARAAYAANDAPALPLESSAARRTPHALSLLTSTVVPRSLNEPVGDRYSSLKWTVRPPKGAATSGVMPSPIDTIGAASSTGSIAR